MKFIWVILLCAALFFVYRYSLLLGIILSVVLVLYGIYHYLPQIYRYKGRVYFNEGNYAAAKRMFKKAVDTGHAKGDIRMEYSYILLRTGDIEEAEQIVNNMLCYKIKPEYRGRAIIQRCMCYYKRGNIDEAIEDGMELFNEGYRSIMLYGMLGFFKITTGIYATICLYAIITAESMRRQKRYQTKFLKKARNLSKHGIMAHR